MAGDVPASPGRFIVLRIGGRSMSVLTVVDAEAAVRTWAKADAGIKAVVSDRVFFASPDAYSSKPPDAWLTLRLISETHSPDDIGLQMALIQFDAWTKMPDQGGTKLKAAQAALAVQQAARQLQFGPPVTVGSAVLMVADVSQKRWLPDPVTAAPRYAVDVMFTLRGTTLS